ncbi:MAG: hypothetical protein ACI906_004729 [Candidatus Latescibacterota bacterium]|jgi:hypothetical protein
MSLFCKKNLLAWCIVPFDACQRTPQQRAEMLQRLGIGALAYDWRQKDIDTFDEELQQLRAHGIRLSAFWLSGGDPPDAQGMWDDPQLGPVLQFIQRNELHIEVWKMLPEKELCAIADIEERYDEATRLVQIQAKVFRDLGCTYGLYNHGGWCGQPQTMVEVARRSAEQQVGIVYNFHHGHEHLSLMPDAFAAMLPHLLCVNLNGMASQGPQVLPLAEGDDDAAILRMVADSGYSGPIGILDHRPDTDAELSLKQNLAGMQTLLRELGDEDALATYQ